VIVQSGPVRTIPLAAAEDRGAALAQRAGAGPNASAADLRALPVEALLHVSREVTVSVDGGLVEESVSQAFRRGDEAKTPMIIGWDSNEASLLRLFGGTPAQWIARSAPAVRAAYGAEAEADMAREMFNDEVMAAPSRWFAQTQAGWRAPAWLYYFDYVPERQRAERPGTNHASEIPFAFDSIDAIPGRAALATPSERAVARLTHACWVAFARTGAPACADGAWTRVGVDRAPAFVFGEAPGLRPDFRKPQLDAQRDANPDLAAEGKPPT
jgi:para-nitrobenzyl esterase